MGQISLCSAEGIVAAISIADFAVNQSGSANSLQTVSLVWRKRAIGHCA
jgi:hypothetical protein